MKRLIVVFLLSFLISPLVKAQSYAQKAAVVVEAKIQTDPWLAIELIWQDDILASKWSIYRKVDSTGEFNLLGTVNAPNTSFKDEDVDAGASYTYLIHKENVNKVMGFALITAGANTKREFDLGTCLVIVEDDLKTPLDNEISTLQNDLIKEGWQVLVKFQASNDKPTDMKKTIADAYTESDSTLKAVILIGNLPVAYSGNMAPDGHVPDHQGAWPTDAYYGDIDGEWTDNTVNITNTPARKETLNKIGDGKFDQNIIPGVTELMVGRIDLEGFEAYENNRVKLYKRYLQRNHDFRVAQYKTGNKSIINDDFVDRVEAFAGSGYRNFPLINGANSVEEGSLLEHALNDTILFAYGCGGGTYTTAGARLRDNNGKRVDSFSVSQTADYFNYNINATFSALFGSYFGDWDNENNLLRAPLAGKSPALATFWAGRPLWHFNDFVHGQPLGYSLHASQNSDMFLFSDIEPSYTYEKWIHIALMGDPTLHMRNIEPLSGLKVTTNEEKDEVYLTWNSQKEHEAFYVMGKVNHEDSTWHLLSYVENKNTFTDTSSLKGNLLFKVIPVNLHNGPTGSYEIFGHFDTIGIQNIRKGVATPEPIQRLAVSVFPNPVKDVLTIKSAQNFDLLLITDLSGKVILEIEPQSNIHELNTTHLSPGLYHVVGFKNRQSFQKQFVIAN
jgi:hypothetical protein